VIALAIHITGQSFAFQADIRRQVNAKELLIVLPKI
jgi:hypothetical protein